MKEISRHCERSEAIQNHEEDSGLPRRPLGLLAMTVLSLSLLLFTGCGFEPVYGKKDATTAGAEDYLSQVEISNIPDREGQYLRNALIDRFYRTERPTSPFYTLTVQKIRETLVDLDITKSSDATRGQLRLNAGLRLTDNQTGEIVLTRNVQAITSYNILASEFATRVSEENARTNALDDLARQIELQLNLYFKR